MVDCICGLTRGQMVRSRSDAADSGDDTGQFFYRSSFTEFLKTAKFRNLEISIGYLSVIIEKNLYFPVPLESGYGVDGNLCHSLRTPFTLRETFPFE